MTEGIVEEKDLNRAKDRYDKNYGHESETEIEYLIGKKNMVEILII